MIILIIYLVGLYIWLLQEVGLIRLPWQAHVIEQLPLYISRSDIHEIAKRINWTHKSCFRGTNPVVIEWLTPLCGWQWIAKHEHDLDNYEPIVHIKFDGFKATMKIQDLSIIKGLVKTITKNYKPYKPSRRKFVDLARAPA